MEGRKDIGGEIKNNGRRMEVYYEDFHCRDCPTEWETKQGINKSEGA